MFRPALPSFLATGKHSTKSVVSITLQPRTAASDAAEAEKARNKQRKQERKEEKRVEKAKELEHAVASGSPS